MLKACFGTAPLNQTVEAQALESLRGLRVSHALDEEKEPALVDSVDQ